MRAYRWFLSGLTIISILCGAAPVSAFTCADLADWLALQKGLQKAVADEKSDLDNDMWATLVSRDGTVCAVSFSGGQFTDQ